MKKQGFVFMELLAVIVILSIILIITVPTVADIIYNVRLNSFIASEKMMVRAAKQYMGTNSEYLPAKIGDTLELKLSLLQSEELISHILDPWDNSDLCSGYVLITKVKANNYDYDPYLKCTYNYKVDSYITDKLVTSWKFDGNAYDYTPNNNEGTINNVSSTSNRFDTPDAALAFNGPSNFIDTNYDYSLSGEGGTTFSLWAKFSIINTDGKIKNIFGKNSQEYLLSQIDNKIRFVQWANDGSYAIKLTSNTNLQVDRWYYIVVVYDSLRERVYLYMNGVIDASDTILDCSFMDKAESLKIGRGFPDIGAAASTFFMGSIDNLSVYNRAWTADEVKLTYDIDRLVNR